MKHRLPLLILVLALAPCGCGGPSDRRQQQAERIIQKIEAFKTKEGRLPSSLDEIGESSEEVFFQAKGKDGYEVSYGEDLGSSRVYRSDTKTWRLSS